MALDKIQQITTETTPPTTPKADAGNVVSEKSSKPIDLKSQKNQTDIQSEIIDYINSEEFKNLPKAEQQKQLKAKFPFLKDFSSEQIQTYITAAKEAVENKKAEDPPKTTETPDQTAETGKNEQTQNQSEIENLALQYKQKNNIKGEIDDIIADLKRKEVSGKELSENEQRLLKLYEEPKNDFVISEDTLVSKEFLNSSSEQKLKTLTVAYLEKQDKKYQILSEEEKEAYLASAMKDITEIVVDKNDTSKFKNEKAEIKGAALIQGAYEDGKTIEELKKLPKEEQQKIISRVENKVIRGLVNQVEKQHKGNISYADKIDAYAETILLNVPEYQNIKDPKAKKEYRDKIVGKYISEIVGIDDWQNCSPAQKRRIQQNIAVAFEYVIKNTGETESIAENLKNFANLPTIDKNKIKINYLSQIEPKTKETLKLLEKCKAENLVYERLNKSNPTNEEFINEIFKMEKEGIKLPETLVRYKKQYIRAQQLKCGKGYDVRERDIYDEAGSVGATGKEYLKNKLSHCKTTEEYMAVLKKTDINLLNDAINELVTTKRLSKKEAQHLIKQMVNENPEYVNKLFIKAEKSDEFVKVLDLSSENLLGKNAKGLNKATAASIETAVSTAVRESSGWYDRNGVAQIGAHTLSMDTEPKIKTLLTKSYTLGLHEHLSREDNKIVFESISNSKMVSASSMANFTKTFIETANNDSDRIYYSKSFSTIDNPAVTEGLAAGAKYVTNPAAKQQYTHYVEVAASKYSPETQAAIKTALKTGEITPTTLTQTTVQEKAQTTTSNTQENLRTTSAPNTSEQLGKNTVVSSPINTTNKVTTNNSSVKQNNSTTNTNTADTISAQSTSYNKTNEDYKTAEAKANLQLKETTLENIAEVKEKIDNSIKEWELKQATKLSDEDVEAIKILAAGDAIDEYIEKHPTEREIIIENLSKAQSINEVYNILVSALGSKVHDKFIEVLASYGSADSIRSFVNSKANDTNVIKKMYLRCNSESLKSELLNLLPESTIREMLEKGDITTLDAVDHKIMYSFLLKNLYSMTSTSFANYLKHLPLDERKRLTELRNQSRNLIPQSQSTSTTQDLTQNITPTTLSTTSNLSTQRNKQDDSIKQSQPMFAQGETIKTLDNGTVITNQGTTFAGISNNTFDEEFRVVDTKPQNKAGSPIGMNDEVLTPGSEEWRRKYNKQQEVPATAFTMAAMTDEDEELGMPFGSTKVGMGQKIKKKYPPKNFRFNA